MVFLLQDNKSRGQNSMIQGLPSYWVALSEEPGANHSSFALKS